jgi:hypothetical protein
MRVLKKRNHAVFLGLLEAMTQEHERDSAVATERHSDPYAVEVPAVAILEECAEVASQRMFA